jgi:hypothetical protein
MYRYQMSPSSRNRSEWRLGDQKWNSGDILLILSLGKPGLLAKREYIKFFCVPRSPSRENALPIEPLEAPRKTQLKRRLIASWEGS